MSQLKSLIFILFLCCLLDTILAQCPHKTKQYYFWKVESPKQTVDSFFFGSIHTSHKNIWQHLPDMVKETFDESDMVVFEASPQSFKPNEKEDYALFLKICPKRDPNDQPYEKILKEDLYERLEKVMEYVQPKDMDEDEWEEFWQSSRLYNLIFTLINAVYKDVSTRDMRGIKELEFEYTLGRMAQKSGKAVEFIEPIEIFCDYKSDLTQDELIYDLEKQIKQIEEIQQIVQEMGTKEYSKMKIKGMEGFHEDYQNATNKYLCGEWVEPKRIVPASKKAGSGSWTKVERIEYEIQRKHEDFLLFYRTKKWVPRIEKLLIENPKKKIFFVLGTRHILGEEGLEKMFNAKPGYTVYSLDAIDIQPKLKKTPKSDDL